jgi:hypothetical protein
LLNLFEIFGITKNIVDLGWKFRIGFFALSGKVNVAEYPSGRAVGAG